MEYTHIPYGPYEKYFKRPLDFVISLVALVAGFPVFLVLTIVGIIVLRGNPFFIQERPGKNEYIFKLIKFRTMTNERDEKGYLLPDEKRLNAYGMWLRTTSLDELPSLVNCMLGQISLVGPRPLLVRYLPLYSREQRRRHEVRPGLTGYAQVHGRNAITWDEKFILDLEYINHITFWGDVKILFLTFCAVLKREGITSATSVTMEEFKGKRGEIQA